MKVSLCFIISYQHILHKESIWKQWIEPNKDIINVYFHYTDKKKIKSEWILQHCLPETKTVNATYYHMVDAYMALISYAYYHDANNTWFCFLTDSCVPIIPPHEFRLRFFQYGYKSIMAWKKAWWNVDFHKRSNLRLLHPSQRLANDPWFVITRVHAEQFLHFRKQQRKLFSLVCQGGLANESLFAIMFLYFRQLANGKVINGTSTIANWENMSSATSPYLFKKGDKYEYDFIENAINKNKNALFLRKIDYEFPDAVILRWIDNKKKWHERFFIKLLCFYYQFKIMLFFSGFLLVLWIFLLRYVLFEKF